MYYDFGFLEHIARAGGGGSASGGGGLGEASLTVSGFLLAVGCVAGLSIAVFFKKYIRSPSIARTFVVIICGSIIAGLVWLTVLANFILITYALGLVGMGLIAGAFFGFVGTWLFGSKRRRAAHDTLRGAARRDAAWNSRQLLDHAQKVFYQFQSDWSVGNRAGYAAYQTPEFSYYNALLSYNLELLQRRNELSNITIQHIDFVQVSDNRDNVQDRFTVAIEGTIDDRLIDLPSGAIIYHDTMPFYEEWRFVRSDGDRWLLEQIKQGTAEYSKTERSLRSFAAKHHLAYRLDMGRLFLPRNGQLIEQRQFDRADINNYCIGMIDSELVQLYTLSFITGYGTENSRKKSQVVAQINVPKSYGKILIRPKRSGGLSAANIWTPPGYQRFTMEWNDFNDRYDVFASDSDHLATFELLNPSFMAYLYDTDSSITLEVTDSIIFLYRKTGGQSELYDVMLTILQKAHKELRQ